MVSSIEAEEENELLHQHMQLGLDQPASRDKELRVEKEQKTVLY